MVLRGKNDEIAGGSNKGVVAEMRNNSYAQKECEFWWSQVEKFESNPPKL